MQATLKCIDDVIHVQGALDFYSVPAVFKRSLTLVSVLEHVHFDFSEVSFCNSAGVALMIEWIKYAKRVKKNIQFMHVPASFESIFYVAGLTDFFKPFVVVS